MGVESIISMLMYDETLSLHGAAEDTLLLILFFLFLSGGLGWFWRSLVKR